MTDITYIKTISRKSAENNEIIVKNTYTQPLGDLRKINLAISLKYYGKY